ncbi:hypothetical protein Pcinc_010802 [Petrolisthes cinctipes]|uniref:Uncharacterized protein n=1 Tax=Petrolisthes cinctipes TaxID=88211 RepID=A0AAE1G483_PETCI|nr:hypothetical protein Pcinc_010802 [Petrolisthes cinctipes]
MKRLDDRIAGGGTDVFYKNLLNKSAVLNWWTRLFPDAFDDDIQDVVEGVKGDRLINLFEAELSPPLDTYVKTCLLLREENNVVPSKSSPLMYSIDVQSSVEGGLYNISKLMAKVIDEYFSSSQHTITL